MIGSKCWMILRPDKYNSALTCTQHFLRTQSIIHLGGHDILLVQCSIKCRTSVNTIKLITHILLVIIVLDLLCVRLLKGPLLNCPTIKNPDTVLLVYVFLSCSSWEPYKRAYIAALPQYMRVLQLTRSWNAAL